MLRTPCALKTQASAPPAGAATSSSGNGAASACSIVKERCWAAARAIPVVSTRAAARHARVREASSMTVLRGWAASKLSLTTSVGKSYLSRQPAALTEDLDHAEENRRGTRRARPLPSLQPGRPRHCQRVAQPGRSAVPGLPGAARLRLCAAHVRPTPRPVPRAARASTARLVADGVLRAGRGLPRDRYGRARGLGRAGTGARGARGHRRPAVLGTGAGGQRRAGAGAAADHGGGGGDRLRRR